MAHKEILWLTLLKERIMQKNKPAGLAPPATTSTKALDAAALWEATKAANASAKATDKVVEINASLLSCTQN